MINLEFGSELPSDADKKLYAWAPEVPEKQFNDLARGADPDSATIFIYIPTTQRDELRKAIVELKKSLLKADVHHKTTKELITAIELETKRVGIGQDSFINALKLELTKVLTTEGNQGFVYSNTPPTTILMTGLQGSGKTTST
mgnify:CR=1 FL=1